MFRHKGKSRTYSHNLRLAALLSVVAGLVNIAGILAVNTLTTNVTGHFAFFSEQLFLKNYGVSVTYLLYIFFFLMGSFLSGLILERGARYGQGSTYVFPILIEVFIITAVTIIPDYFFSDQIFRSNLISSSLLFAMGLQNALVTRVSQSVVRTTHLTGLFTDLGIELSQLLFYREKQDQVKLNRNIFLKLMIISSFFLGGILGGIGYRHFELKVLLAPSGLLLFAIWYDRLLFRYYSFKRRFKDRSHLHL